MVQSVGGTASRSVVAQGRSGERSTFTNKTNAKMPDLNTWHKRPLTDAYRKEWDSFAKDLRVDPQDKKNFPLIIDAMSRFSNMILLAKSRGVPPSKSAQMVAVKDALANKAAAQTNSIMPQVQRFAPKTTAQLKELTSPTGGLTQTGRAGVAALANDPTLSDTKWGASFAASMQNVRTNVAFAAGFGEGVFNGCKDMVVGLATIAGKTAQYVTDATLGLVVDPIRSLLPSGAQEWMRASEAIPSAERSAATTQKMIDTVGKAASYIYDNTPEKVGADIKGFITKNWDKLEASHAAAAKQGPEAEAHWWGQVAGRATFEVAAFAVPVTKVAQLAKLEKAADVAKGVDAVSDAGRLAAKAPLIEDALKAEALATIGKSLAVAKAVRAMAPTAAREFLLGLDNFAARENILRTLVSDPKLLDVATKPNRATFYSGRVELKAGQYLRAREWAETFSNRTILEQTSGGHWLDQVKTYEKLISRSVADEIWTTLSSRYAGSVSGQVVVVRGAMRADAVLHAEMKILEAAQKSGKITELKIIDLHTVIEKLGK